MSRATYYYNYLCCVSYLPRLQGNLAPEFAVGKITGKEGTKFVGPARCFDQEEDMMAAVASDAPQFKGCVIVIRYEGPKGGPGMKEMLNPTAIVMGAGLGQVSTCPVRESRVVGKAARCTVRAQPCRHTVTYLLTGGRTWRSSPTAASRAAATDSASDTSRPRRRWRPHLALLLLE